MTITGLSQNNYLINNEIQVVVSGFTTTIIYLEITAFNFETNITQTVRLYPINNSFSFSISSLVKSTFANPNLNLDLTINKVSLTFTALDNTNTIIDDSIVKSFIRGGNQQGYYLDGITEKKNYLPSNVPLQLLITQRIPYWAGFTPDVVQRIVSGVFTDYNLASNEKEIMPDTCKGKFVKFLNMYGTYSHWFFDSYEERDSSKDYGYINKTPNNFVDNNFDDLGVSSSKEIELRTIVPYAYNELFKHLIYSPEVYIVEGKEFRLKQKSQKHFKNELDLVYEYKFVFEVVTVINPSLLC